VKDNPQLEYLEIKDFIKDFPKIKIIQNEKNLGNNGSKNKALDSISNTDYVTFLDDDDWFDIKTLEIANENINKNLSYKWFVSNRALENGEKITLNKTKNKSVNYVLDVLILKRFFGDATHFINFKEYKNVRYSKNVKLTEEWFYFSQLKGNFFYYDFNSTYQNILNDSNMTHFYNKNKVNRLKNTYLLFKELFLLNKINLIIWFIYLPLRIAAIILKR
jgi:glycosyltransferase involved in cell wall biosynthesis